MERYKAENKGGCLLSDGVINILENNASRSHLFCCINLLHLLFFSKVRYARCSECTAAYFPLIICTAF